MFKDNDKKIEKLENIKTFIKNILVALNKIISILELKLYSFRHKIPLLRIIKTIINKYKLIQSYSFCFQLTLRFLSWIIFNVLYKYILNLDSESMIINPYKIGLMRIMKNLKIKMTKKIIDNEEEKILSKHCKCYIVDLK